MLFSKAAKGSFKTALVIAALWGGALQAREVVDVTGAKVSLVDQPKRIVTLAPSLAELVADLEGEFMGRLIGVSDFTDYPPALKKVPSIGSYAKFNLEKVVALKPDVVFATQDGNPKDQVLRLREMGVPVVVVSTSTLGEVYESIRIVSTSLGVKPEGDQIIKRLKEGVENIRKRVETRLKGSKPPRVLLQIGDDPLVVVGKGSFLHEALEVVGAKNVYGDLKDNYPRPSLEDVFSRDPEVVVVLAMTEDLGPFYTMARKWERYGILAASKNERIHVLQGDTILRPTLRLLEGLSKLERAIHGK